MDHFSVEMSNKDDLTGTVGLNRVVKRHTSESPNGAPPFSQAWSPTRPVVSPKELLESRPACQPGSLFLPSPQKQNGTEGIMSCSSVAAVRIGASNIEPPLRNVSKLAGWQLCRTLLVHRSFHIRYNGQVFSP